MQSACAKKISTKNVNSGKYEFLNENAASKWKLLLKMAPNMLRKIFSRVFRSFSLFKRFFESCQNLQLANRIDLDEAASIQHTPFYGPVGVCVWKVTMLLSQRENLSFSRKINRKLRQMQQKLQIAHGKSKAMESGGGAGHSTDT